MRGGQAATEAAAKEAASEAAAGGVALKGDTDRGRRAHGYMHSRMSAPRG